MNVFITRYENVKPYSTARKAIESVCGQEWQVYTNDTGNPDDGKQWDLNASSVAKAIKQLNREGFISLYSSTGQEQMEIVKAKVL